MVVASAANKVEIDEVHVLGSVGEIDVEAKKGYHSEVEATVESEVVQDEDGEYTLKANNDGTHNTIYAFDAVDDIDMTFDLPFNVELDAGRATDGLYDPSGGLQVGVPIEADAESSFEKTVDIPLTDDYRNADYNRNLFLENYSGSGTSTENGNVEG